MGLRDIVEVVAGHLSAHGVGILVVEHLQVSRQRLLHRLTVDVGDVAVGDGLLRDVGTDVSDVSHTVPTVMLSAACMCKGTPLHHWAATAQAGMSIGQKGMAYAAECMAAGAYRLMTEPALLEKAWEEM